MQDLEGLCREAGKQAADWAASIRSTAELADETGYELCSGRNRSLVVIKSEKRERTRQVMHIAHCTLHIALMVCCRDSSIGQCMEYHTQAAPLKGSTFVLGTMRIWHM